MRVLPFFCFYFMAAMMPCVTTARLSGRNAGAERPVVPRGQANRQLSTLRQGCDPHAMVSVGSSGGRGSPGGRGGAAGGPHVPCPDDAVGEEEIPRMFPSRDAATHSSVASRFIWQDTIWNDASVEYRLEETGVQVMPGATLFIEGTEDSPVQVIFQTEGQSVYVHDGAELVLTHAKLVGGDETQLLGSGIELAQSGGAKLDVDGLHCKGLHTCASVYGTMDVHIKNSTIEDSELGLLGATTGPFPFQHKVTGTNIRNCTVGADGIGWAFGNTTFSGNNVAVQGMGTSIIESKLVDNMVGIRKTFNSNGGTLSDVLLQGNKVAIDSACEYDLTNVTFSSNEVGLNCSQGEWVEVTGGHAYWDTGGIGNLERVNFLDSTIAIRWSSQADVSLVGDSIYWGTTDSATVGSYILDDADGYGDGGAVLFDAGNLVSTPFVHSMYSQVV